MDDSDEEESDSDEGACLHTTSPHRTGESEVELQPGSVSRQSVRFSLVDVAGALMRASREEFAEAGHGDMRCAGCEGNTSTVLSRDRWASQSSWGLRLMV